MAYAEQLQSSLKYLIAAGEVGRRSLDEMLGPLNGAIGEMTGAASELENIPFIGPAIGEKLQRTMRSISVAQSKVGQVAAMYGQATSAASQVQERMGALQEQASKAGAAINRVAGGISPTLGNIVPTGSFATQMTPAPEAVKPFPHLLIVQPLKPEAQPYYFNLDTAAFDELRRQTAFRWAGQERLTRSIAQQAVGLGDDKLSLKGAIFPGFKGGLKQLDTLRSTDLFAERMINALDFKVGLDGEYLVDSVEQVFTQSGWTTAVECNGGKSGKAKAKGKKKKEKKPVKVVQL